MVLTPAILSSESACSMRAIAVGRSGPDDAELREHRVVVPRDLHARRERRIEPHRRPARKLQRLDAPERRARSRRRGPRRRSGTRSRARAGATSACENESGRPAATRICSFTMSTPVVELGDRVLDLEARVHLEEVEGAVLVDEELDGPGVRVADRRPRPRAPPRTSPPAARASCAATATPRSPSGGAAAPSTRARTGATSRPVRVAEDLDLDVPRPLDHLLEVDGRVAERAERLGLRALERRTRARPRSATIRMPLPPPPADAFSITGKPIARGLGSSVAQRARGPRPGSRARRRPSRSRGSAPCRPSPRSRRATVR